jgi:hypothetical protein
MKKKYQEIKAAQIQSVKYVNDPAAAKQYYALFLGVVQRIIEDEMIQHNQEL